MSKSRDPRGELRAAFTHRILNRARESANGGAHGLLIRVALATLFLALVLVSYELLGTTGLVFVSTSFIILVFMPALVQTIRNRRRKNAATPEVADDALAVQPASDT